MWQKKCKYKAITVNRVIDCYKRNSELIEVIKSHFPNIKRGETVMFFVEKPFHFRYTSIKELEETLQFNEELHEFCENRLLYGGRKISTYKLK